MPVADVTKGKYHSMLRSLQGRGSYLLRASLFSKMRSIMLKERLLKIKAIGNIIVLHLSTRPLLQLNDLMKEIFLGYSIWRCLHLGR